MDSGVPDPLARLAAYMSSQPDFVAAGVEPGGVWGRFRDGRPFLFLDDFQAVGGPALAAKALPRRAAQAVTKQGMPGGRKALLMQISVPETSGHGPTLTAIERALSARNESCRRSTGGSCRSTRTCRSRRGPIPPRCGTTRRSGVER